MVRCSGSGVSGFDREAELLAKLRTSLTAFGVGTVALAILLRG